MLLIVADLRRSAVHKFFGIRNKGGLTNVIIGQKSLEDGSIRQTKVPNLFVLLAANPTPSPAELLSSQAMEAVLAH